MKIQGIVFDKDGTLFDFNATWGTWAKGMIEGEAQDQGELEQLCVALGYDITAEVFLQGSIVIAETASVIADTIIKVLPRLDKNALLNRMNTMAATAPQVPAKDLRTTLDALRDMGLQLGVATNDSEAPARAHLAQAQITDAFAVILGADSGFGGKPDTGQLDQFCTVTGLKAQRCLMVGDSLHDLHAGRAAGMLPIGVLTGPAPRAELAPHAEVVLNSIAELPAWIAAKG